MYDKFRKYSKEWMKEHSVQPDSIENWLMGHNLPLSQQVKTVCIKENYMKKAPYHIYYRYKVTQQPAHLKIVPKQPEITEFEFSTTSESLANDINQQNNRFISSEKKN
jgi:hypothetical protein